MYIICQNNGLFYSILQKVGIFDSILQTKGKFYSIVQNDGIFDTISQNKARFCGIGYLIHNRSYLMQLTPWKLIHRTFTV